MSYKKRDLKKWMDKNRFNQSSLSRELGIASSTVFEWLNRGRIPHASTMYEFDRLLNRIETKPFAAREFFDISDKDKKYY